MTTDDLRPGHYVELDHQTRVIRRIIPHPAGRAAEWVGGGATTLRRIASEGRVIPTPLRNPDARLQLAD